jgi:hypothetical protein
MEMYEKPQDQESLTMEALCLRLPEEAGESEVFGHGGAVLLLGNDMINCMRKGREGLRERGPTINGPESRVKLQTPTNDLAIRISGFL